MTEFSDDTLRNAVAQGKTMRQIAEEFDVHPSTVSRHMKRLNLSRVSQGAYYAALTLEEDVNAQYELNKLFRRADNILCQLEQVLDGKKSFEDIQFLLGKKSLHDAIVDQHKILRSQISLMKDVAETLYNARQVREFQQFVVDEVKQESPETAQRIVKRLTQINSLYNTLEPEQ